MTALSTDVVRCRSGTNRHEPKAIVRKDIVVAIDIAHRDRFDRPVDECEMRCLREMKEALKQLGARPERW